MVWGHGVMVETPGLVEYTGSGGKHGIWWKTRGLSGKHGVISPNNEFSSLK